jgi:GNAT superfamily N-acetyltransferase
MKIEINENEEKLKEVLTEIFVQDTKERNINSNFRAFSFSVRDDNGKILGGVRGFRIFNAIYIDKLAIDKSIRKQGYAKKLLETIELEVNDGSCDNLNLTTTEFQEAIGFYKKCGFKIDFIRRNDKDARSTKYYLSKKI